MGTCLALPSRILEKGHQSAPEYTSHTPVLPNIHPFNADIPVSMMDFTSAVAESMDYRVHSPRVFKSTPVY